MRTLFAQTQPHWQARFDGNAKHCTLTARLDRQKAITAIARKLLLRVWHVLTAQTADRWPCWAMPADADKVAGKLMVWSWDLTDDLRGGLTTRQFIPARLLRLGLGDELTHLYRGRARRLTAPAEEVLALKADLRPTL